MIKNVVYILLLSALSAVALATPRENDCIGNCQTTNNTDNSTNQAQQQAQGQVQGQIAVGTGGEGGAATGGNVNFIVPEGGLVGPTTNNLSIPEGAVQLNVDEGAVSPSATAGSSSGAYSASASTVGDTTSTSDSVSGSSSGGNTTEQGVEVDASEVTETVNNLVQNWDYPVSSAASVYAQTCQSGMSGQSEEFGASVLSSDALCDAMKVTVYWAQAVEAETDPTYKALFMERYYESLEAVNELAEKTETVGLIDRWFSFIIKPIAVIGILAFLL